MDTIWIWGWCLLPLLFIGIMAVACVARAGGCACGHGGPRNENGARPGTPAR